MHCMVLSNTPLENANNPNQVVDRDTPFKEFPICLNQEESSADFSCQNGDKSERVCPNTFDNDIDIVRHINHSCYYVDGKIGQVRGKFLADTGSSIFVITWKVV